MHHIIDLLLNTGIYYFLIVHIYTEEEELEIVQRRAMKIITSAIIRTPTNNLHNELALETLKKR